MCLFLRHIVSISFKVEGLSLRRLGLQSLGLAQKDSLLLLMI
jgi:hypothetical protein